MLPASSIYNLEAHVYLKFIDLGSLKPLYLFFPTWLHLIVSFSALHHYSVLLIGVLGWEAQPSLIEILEVREGCYLKLW
jgi:hypothetical protein